MSRQPNNLGVRGRAGVSVITCPLCDHWEGTWRPGRGALGRFCGTEGQNATQSPLTRSRSAPQITSMSLQPSPPVNPLAGRLIRDRRGGVDRRAAPRRATVTRSSVERRSKVDRRRGPEQRSGRDRRSWSGRSAFTETPREHLRNALQLLGQASDSSRLDPECRADLTAAVGRIHHALSLLEQRSP